MTVRDIPELITGEIIQGDFEDTEVRGCYTSDLLSDVMANAGDATVLITIQAHKNAVAVASLNDIRAVVICNDRPITDDMIEAASNEAIAVIRTGRNQFEVSGLLYRALGS